MSERELKSVVLFLFLLAIVACSGPPADAVGELTCLTSTGDSVASISVEMWGPPEALLTAQGVFGNRDGVRCTLHLDAARLPKE